MKQPIRLAALDLDGTLFNNESRISLQNQDAIASCIQMGTEIVIATGRPYAGLPAEQLAALGIRYAITANGAAIYKLPEKECIFEDCIPPAVLLPLLDMLQQAEVHLDVFAHGNGYTTYACAARIDRLAMPESIRAYIRQTRILTDDLAGYIRTHHLPVQKALVNFYPQPDGTFAHREEIKALLASYPQITALSGGYHNLEFTKAGVTKGQGLLFLCRRLHISANETIAIGDTQNDLDILRTAAIGVAMGNADATVRACADFVTLTNENDGVAHALKHLIL